MKTHLSRKSAILVVLVGWAALVPAGAATAQRGKPTPPPTLVPDIAYVVGTKSGKYDLKTMNVDGSNQYSVLAGIGESGWIDPRPALSPDGARIAFYGIVGGVPGHWIVQRDGTGAVKFADLGDAGTPRWSPAPSPDGRPKILFAEIGPIPDDPEGKDSAELFVADVDGSNRQRLTLHERGPYVHWRFGEWSRDARRIVYNLKESDGSDRLWMATLVVDGAGLALTDMRNLSDEMGWGQPGQLSHMLLDYTPVWANRSDKIVVSGRTVPGYVATTRVIDLSGAGPVPTVFPVNAGSPSWTADDSKIVYWLGGKIWRINADSTGTQTLGVTGRHPNHRRVP